MKLSNRHHKNVLKIYNKYTLPRYRKNKVCSQCRNERFIGVDKENKLIVCPRCVQVDKAWIDYAKYEKSNIDISFFNIIELIKKFFKKIGIKLKKIFFHK